ncbi:unnamed protein product [Blepharisma stoltei]|uniref:Uncharacterized protein n=1 Tax=Blepharisma stoltei TaxID=1481888 RepID=A0AAU9IJF2_9CILI|nr:unnamed protein product [Blepharisma stoltei]
MTHHNFNYLSRVAAAYEGMAISRFALHKIRKEVIKEGLAKDDEVVGGLLICKKCSEKLIPGKSCDFMIEKIRKKTYKNAVVYRCKRCGGVTRFKGIDKRDEKPKKTDKERVTPIKYTEEDIQRILNKIPTGHRNLSSKKQIKPKKEEKKSLIDSFFEGSNGSSLYNLFH